MKTRFRLLLASAGLAFPLAAQAQSLPYGDAGSGDDTSVSSGAAHRGASGPRLTVTPYIEAAQIVTAELSPGDEVLTYTSIAAGVDAAVNGRYNQGALSLRYERRIGWGKANSGDIVSGLARGSAAIIPGTLTFEAGALAARSKIEVNGQSVLGSAAQDDAVTQLWSVYAGPSLATHVGDVALSSNYRIGYSEVGTPNVALTPSGASVDLFDHSVVQNADVHAGIRPGYGLPVGIGIGGGWHQEDVSNLDQRVRDLHARADVTLPVGRDLALVGGVGYEDVEVSSRDVLRDTLGNPVINSKGRYVTDKSAPRRLAFDTEGLIWDAGVIWRPSRRTALEAHVGRRYGSTSYYGTFAYAPNERSAFNVAVYDNITGFGGQVNRALADLPTDFEVVRNPLTGDLTGCVNSLQAGGCLSGVLGSLRSSTYRSRGVAASYTHRFGRLTAGVALGYDRRRYIAAPGTILAVANGVVDENFWANWFLAGRLDERSSFNANVYANSFHSGFASTGDGTAFGASASYNRALTNHLSATAALGIDGISRELLADIWSASALVGVRYSF